MAPVLAAKVWHYWLSYVLLGGSIAVVVGWFIVYFVKITSMRPPRQ
ncbi:MAG TPA: hypothetical protein VKI20_05865 [Acidimicrobiales bacterium]|nr:hypothetical protein [Acidimicrobiales bacterium]